MGLEALYSANLHLRLNGQYFGGGLGGGGWLPTNPGWEAATMLSCPSTPPPGRQVLDPGGA